MPITKPVSVNVISSPSNGPKLEGSLPICMAAINEVGLLSSVPTKASIPSLDAGILNSPVSDNKPIDTPKFGLVPLSTSVNTTTVPAFIEVVPVNQVSVPSPEVIPPAPSDSLSVM